MCSGQLCLSNKCSLLFVTHESYVRSGSRYCFIRNSCFLGIKYRVLYGKPTQCVSRLVDITAGGDFLGLYDKNFHINMCPILDVYGVMGIF